MWELFCKILIYSLCITLPGHGRQESLTHQQSNQCVALSEAFTVLSVDHIKLHVMKYVLQLSNTLNSWIS